MIRRHPRAIAAIIEQPDMQVVSVQNEDFVAWLTLAAEVEPLFGPMVNDPRFHHALQKNISRGTAYCIRCEDAHVGAPLLGAMLFSASNQPQGYKIGWLAVAASARRQGLGRALVNHALGTIAKPAEIAVVTFTDEQPGGLPARQFYESLGFVPAESATGPNGEPRQVFRLSIRL